MNANTPLPAATPRLHPLVATAAVAVTVFSLAGVAALAGLLPAGQAAPAATVPAAPPIAAQPVIAAAKPEVPKVVEKIVYVERPAPKPAVREAAPPPVAAAPTPVPAPADSVPPPCLNCGTIDSVREVAQPGEGSGLGAVAGGVVGGLLGSQVGGGSGKTIATVLGVAGGAYAGHEIEKARKKTTRHEITVRMSDGTLRTLTQDSVPAWRSGDRVRIENGALVAAG
jgi:outer membrane lipoprotein SlyB